MDIQSARARLSEWLEQIDAMRFCGPSDDPDEQTQVVYGFRHLLQAVKRAGRIIQDDQLRWDLEQIPLPSDIYSVYDSNAALNALIPEIREELDAGIPTLDPVSRQPKQIKVFVSYSTADKKIAGQVKQFYTAYKIEAFLAHEDIAVSQEWKDRIIEELKQANVFVSILSSNFTTSDWTSQEIGIAFARGGVLFVPLSLDGTIPYGFVSHIQSQPILATGVTPDLLIEPLVQRFPRLVLPLLIDRLSKALSFREAESLMLPLVPHFSRFTETEANAFASASADNPQIWDAHLCRKEYLPAFLRAQRERISRQTLNDLEHNLADRK